jgi:formylmethanofuran dehydrogenase subunit C
VKPLALTLRQTPEQRLDMSPLVPHRLAGKTAAEIARIELQTTRVRVTVGDIFRLRMGDAGQIQIENACERLDCIGHDMTDGEIVVQGDVGIQAGRMMRGGRVSNAGDRLGGPLAGEMTGMRGGIVIIRGHAGERAGDRLRRGTILVEGGAGRYAGCRMIAGTLAVRRKVGPLPGYLMRRGTLILGEGAGALSPTFVDCGTHDLVALRIMALFVETYSPRLASVLRQTRRRFAGDMAVSGKGEIFTLP